MYHLAGDFAGLKDPKIDDKIPIDIYIVVGIVMCFIVINISYKLRR